MSDLPSVDEGALQELKVITEDAFQTIVQTFLDSGEQTIHDIEAAYQSRNFENLHFHAHSLKGASANMGALKLSDLCAQINVLAKASSTENMEEIIKQCCDEWQVVKAYFLHLISSE